MERRNFLLGLVGLAGVATVSGMLRPQYAEAAMPRTGNGILDELEADSAAIEPEATDEDGVVEPVSHRPGHRRRRRRRSVWRRVCRRVRHRGRWVRRCYRRRVWVSIWI